MKLGIPKMIWMVLCSLAHAEVTYVRMTICNQNMYQELMVIKDTFVPQSHLLLFVYQTGYICSIIHPWLRDEYTLHHTPNRLSWKNIYDMVDMVSSEFMFLQVQANPQHTTEKR